MLRYKEFLIYTFRIDFMENFYSVITAKLKNNKTTAVISMYGIWNFLDIYLSTLMSY